MGTLPAFGWLTFRVLIVRGDAKHSRGQPK